MPGDAKAAKQPTTSTADSTGSNTEGVEMKWLHRLIGHKQRIRESMLWDRRDYCFCSCGAVFDP